MQAQKQRRQRTLRRLRWCGIPFFPSECNAQSGFLLQLVRSLRSLRDPRPAANKCNCKWFNESCPVTTMDIRAENQELHNAQMLNQAAQKNLTLLKENVTSGRYFEVKDPGAPDVKMLNYSCLPLEEVSTLLCWACTLSLMFTWACAWSLGLILTCSPILGLLGLLNHLRYDCRRRGFLLDMLALSWGFV